MLCVFYYYEKNNWFWYDFYRYWRCDWEPHRKRMPLHTAYSSTYCPRNETILL